MLCRVVADKYDPGREFASAEPLVSKLLPSLPEPFIMTSRKDFFGIVRNSSVQTKLDEVLHLGGDRSAGNSTGLENELVRRYSLGDLEKGMAQIRKCLHSDPDSKVCKALLKQEKAIEKTIAKVNKAFSKNQPSTGTKYLVQSGEDKGLIQEVKDQDAALREEGTIPAAAPKNLITTLVGLACRGHYDVCPMSRDPTSRRTVLTPHCR